MGDVLRERERISKLLLSSVYGIAPPGVMRLCFVGPAALPVPVRRGQARPPVLRGADGRASSGLSFEPEYDGRAFRAGRGWLQGRLLIGPPSRPPPLSVKGACTMN